MRLHKTSMIALLLLGVAGFAGSALAQTQQSASSSAQTQATNPPSQTQTGASAVKTAASAPAAVQTNKYIEVPTGTRLPLVLHNAISTRSARVGDRVYLETLFPILIGEKIVIPAGSYVGGEVRELKRGRGRRAEISIKLDNLILPNGYEARFDAVPTDAGTGGKETVDKEGTIRADKNTAGDAKTVVEGTAIGAGVGGITTRSGTGAGVGAGLGAVAGLITAHFSRRDVELPRGTTLDVVLDRPLYLLSAKIHFTSPGQASTLPGPPLRQSQGGIIPH